MSRPDATISAAERHAHKAGVEAKLNDQPREAAPDVLPPDLLAAWQQGWDADGVPNEEEEPRPRGAGEPWNLADATDATEDGGIYSHRGLHRSAES